MIKKFVKLYDIGNFMEFLKGVYHFYFLKLWNNLKTKFSICGLFKIFWLTVRYYKKVSSNMYFLAFANLNLGDTRFLIG